ncbi:hypothetical protein QQS21_011171 [Conoideocrella luteorostrata]|uniref:Yeast cell wall synthesis Kre9/Knh1-like N-terminal domain-containing protein n=1 Tax=Conoideocrella luteorostrata TaxID=1105319 RepID=A0AAJ0FTZ4_9HYPO|nr:hypothetical protein QQS21_011171 [Conoideocrella luteorostrata]
MRFSVAAVLAFAATALAQEPTHDFDPVSKPAMNEVITAGKTFTITWDAIAKYADGTISIELIGGATQPTQQHVDNIASGIKNKDNSYTWNVGANLGDKKVYGLVLRLESDPKIFQYSNPFQIKGSDSKPTGSDTVTMTKSHGIKTVTLSSSSTTSASTSTSCTTTAAASTSSNSNSSSSSSSIKTKHHSTTAIANSTTTLVQSTISQSTSIDVPTTTAPNAPATTTSSVVSPTKTAAASAIRAGSLAIFGAVAALLVL